MNNYDDIIDREYTGSASHKRMSMEARAAQFAPFAALTGHNDAIAETARLTSERIELAPDEQRDLSRRLTLALSIMSERPCLAITYFLPDPHKSGGRYVTVTAHIAKYIECDNALLLSDGTVVSIPDITAIDGDIFTNRATEF